VGEAGNDAAGGVIDMEPLLLLWLLVGVTLFAVAWQRIVDVRWRRRLRELAAQWRMNYVPDDRFRLADRVRNRLPVVGAADVRAWDLMYHTEGGRREYLFTVEYGIGAVGSQRRRKCVAALNEPVSDEQGGGHADSMLAVGPPEMQLMEQYRHLYEQFYSRK
jgi:hypothetical protein